MPRKKKLLYTYEEMLDLAYNAGSVGLVWAKFAPMVRLTVAESMEFKGEYDRGDADGCMQIDKTMHKLATQGNQVIAGIFAQKTRCGRIEGQRHEISTSGKTLFVWQKPEAP